LPEPDKRDELRARLRRLPGQLLLALINGTALLVIVAAIIALVAISKVTNLANDVASTMTDAVLSRIGSQQGSDAGEHEVMSYGPCHRPR
jgi:hypothetical protein